MQLDLLDVAKRLGPSSPLTLEQRFERFHAENPRVFEEMLRLARRRLDRGETFISVKALWEELRTSLSAKSTEPYRLNNSFTALYSRMLLDADQRLVDVIETRRRKAKSAASAPVDASSTRARVRGAE